MKVLLISRRCPPLRCGVGDYAVELARFLQTRGEEVCILTEPADGPRPAGMRVIEQPMRGWRDLPSVLRAICDEKPGVVQLEYSQYGWSRWGCAFWLNALLAALRWRSVPVRLALHEFPILFRQHPKLTAFALLQRLHFWLLGAAANEIFTNTVERVAILHRWFPWRKSRVHYRPNSNCNPVFPFSEDDREALRKTRGVPPGSTVLVVYGFYGVGKNIETAIEASIEVQRQLAVQLWLLGDTTLTQRKRLARLRSLSAQLGHNAFWSGPLSPQEVSQYLQAADILLLPQPDGHLTRSSVFMAAAAHRMCVIAVRNEKCQREFTHGDNVWLVSEATPALFAQAISVLATMPALRARLGANLGELYTSTFSWPAQFRRETHVDGQRVPQNRDLANAGTSRLAE